VVLLFVGVGGIIDHHRLNFLFITNKIYYFRHIISLTTQIGLEATVGK
jgi:inorganic pyrophosphatase/exopolyphosphatase